LYLFRFDFTLKHVPGTKIGKVNSLSRRLDWKVEVDKDNEDQVFIKDCWLYSLHEVVIKVSSSQMVDLGFSLFYFLFLFSFCFIFYFLFLEQLGLELIGHAVTSVTT